MEVQQDFRSVNIYGAAGETELQLSSSSTSSPALSSPRSSPHSTDSSVSSAPIYQPPSADLPPAAVQSSGGVVFSVRVVPSVYVGTPQPVYSREQALKSLKESIPHAMRLQQLHKEERAHHKDAIWNKKSVRRLSKELYLIVSMYALLQGALFTAVAQSTTFTCADWWGPIGIVGAVTVGTIIGTWDKLHRMGCQKQEVKKFERRQSAVYDKIMQLYSEGSACCIDTLGPGHTEQFDEEPGMRCISSLQGLLVLGFLAGFSLLIMTSCLLMLCRPCRCQQ